MSLGPLFLAFVLAPPSPKLRVAVVARGELLGSEAKALARIERALGKRGTLYAGPADDAERAFADAIFAGDAAPATAPARWRADRAVILVEILPPRGDAPQRISRGLGAIAIVHPDGELVYLEAADGAADIGLPDALGAWLAEAPR